MLINIILQFFHCNRYNTNLFLFFFQIVKCQSITTLTLCGRCPRSGDIFKSSQESIIPQQTPLKITKMTKHYRPLCLVIQMFRPTSEITMYNSSEKFPGSQFRMRSRETLRSLKSYYEKVIAKRQICSDLLVLLKAKSADRKRLTYFIFYLLRCQSISFVTFYGSTIFNFNLQSGCVLGATVELLKQ